MNNLGNKSVMAENIQYYLDLNHKERADLCRDLGFKYTTVSNWLQGVKYPRIDKIEMMARYFGITKADLVEKRSTTPPPNALPLDTYTYKIPLLGRVAAGEPIYADEHIESYEYIDSRYKDDGNEYFALRIDGQSMEPTIMDGDIVIVRQQSFAENGQIAIVLIDGEDATAKEVKEGPDGITLIGHNVAVYTPHFYSHKQIEELPVKIIGVVTEIRRRLIV